MKRNTNKILFFLLLGSLIAIIVMFWLAALFAYIHIPYYTVGEVENVVNMPCWKFIFLVSAKWAYFVSVGFLLHHYYYSWKKEMKK